MYILVMFCALVSLVLSGGIFGFFYAWICSTMWGLDAADPAIAIAAMQAMNGSVRNAVFAPAFFGTPAVLGLTAVLAFVVKNRLAGWAYITAAMIYFLGGLVLTISINVPMNEALAQVALPLSAEEARQIWQDYSAPWQFWNTTRTLFSGLALICTGLGLVALGRQNMPVSAQSPVAAKLPASV